MAHETSVTGDTGSTKAAGVDDVKGLAGTGSKENASVHKANGDSNLKPAGDADSNSNGDAQDAEYAIVGGSSSRSATPTLVPDDHRNDELVFVNATEKKGSSTPLGHMEEKNTTTTTKEDEAKKGSSADGTAAKDTNKGAENSPSKDYVDVGSEFAKARLIPPSRPESALSTATNDKFFDADDDANWFGA